MSALVRKLLSQIDPQAWLRFFAALIALTVAFAAALYSSIFADLGNALTTAILASLALILAGVVGITTVPYLAKRVAARRIRERFQYEFTKEGAAYLVLLLVIVVAALNTGNNMLYIVVAAMLAAIVVSGLASAGLLRALELEVVLPEHAFARQEMLGRVMLRNMRWWMPAFSISVGPLAKSKKQRKGWQRGVFVFPKKKPWIRLVDWVWKPLPTNAPPQIFSGAVYFPYIARSAASSAEVALTFPRRGTYQQEKLGISTRFPFSFLRKTRPIGMGRKLLVYPAVEQTEEFFRLLPLITGEFETYVRGRGNNLFLIREYLPDDPAHHVDWKATAKTGALKVREFAREDERRVRIVFDNPAPGQMSDAAYEGAVSLAASLAWHFARSESHLTMVVPGYCGTDVYGFLAALAEIQPAAAPSLLAELPPTEEYNVILTAQPRGGISTSLWSSSYFLFMQEMR